MSGKELWSPIPRKEERMIKEEDGSCSDASDHEAATSSSIPVSSNTNCVSSSTNGNGHHGVAATSSGVIASPLRRTLDEATRKHILGNALVAVGTQMVSAAVAAANTNSPLTFGALSLEGATSQLSSILQIDHRTGSGLDHLQGSSNKSSGSEGSNSTSPLSVNMGSASGSARGSRGRRAKPRAADSPASGSTTSTTTVQIPGGRERQFTCNICDRSFGYKHVLQNHERTHTGEKPFECRVCNKRFTRDHHLKTHMRLHTGEKPYHCKHCDRHFVQVANLRRHMRVHTGERPYPCQLCDSKFSDSNQLKAHTLIHRNEKPFSCEKCNGTFRRRHHMQNHKCPKDFANLGKPRRGRRPREPYDDMMSPPGLVPAPGSVSPPSMSTNGLLPSSSLSTVSSSTAAFPMSSGLLYPANLSDLLNMNQRHLPSLLAISRTNNNNNDTPVDRVEAFRSNLPPPAHSASAGLDKRLSSESTSKSRRKPKTTVRILTDEQRHRYLMDTESIQTQPLNMAVKPRSYSSGADGVLDLSSRSKSDVESDTEVDRKDWNDPYEEDHDDQEDDMEDESDPQDLSRRSNNNSKNGYHSSYHKEILRS